MVDPRRRRLLTWFAATAVLAVAAPWSWRHWCKRFLRSHADEKPPTIAVAAPAPSASRERFARALRLPGREGLLAEVALTRPLTLTAQIADIDIFDGAPTALWHYAGRVDNHDVENPLLRIHSGESLDVTLINHLPEDTTIHWHGLLIDEANDGSGLHPVATAQQAKYRLSVRNRAGLYWYHAHPHGRTGMQLHRGLAGLLLIDDAEEQQLRDALGLKWGERDLPLLLADKQVNGANAIVYKEDKPDDWVGNRVLVNWTPEPHLDVVPALYRLRIANVANARMWRLAFVHRDRVLPFHLIGTDGGLLAQAWRIEDLFLAPAQRADVLVDFSEVPSGERVLLRSLDYLAMESEDESGAFAPDPMGDHPGAVPMGALLDVMEFRIGVAPRSSNVGHVPERLADVPSLADTKGWPLRQLRLRMDEEGTWFINDWNFHKTGHAPVFSVKRGTREVWEIRNSMTSMPHPIHLHGVQFRIVSRSISPMDIRARAVAPGGLTPQDLGWNDTVVVWPGEVVRLALDFSQPFRGTQRYMLHCHNLEHEDMGMMVTFAVVD